MFCRCYELKGYFPEDYCLVISVWDHDKRCKDDLIGETKIDIENRFYTKHRARCGLAMDYTEYVRMYKEAFITEQYNCCHLPLMSYSLSNTKTRRN